MPSSEIIVYIGSYASKTENGIHAYKFSESDGKLSHVGSVAGTENPSYLAVNASTNKLYAVGESGAGKDGGQLAELDLSTGTRLPVLRRSVSTVGAGPCHVSLGRTGNWLVTANYGSSSLTLFPLSTTGEVGEASDFVVHTGSGPNPDRQQEPHPHSVFIDPSGSRVIVPDLGLDQIVVYEVDKSANKLIELRRIASAPGSGPRHAAFHPDGGTVYVINELSSTVDVFDYDTADGQLWLKQTIPALPDDFAGNSSCADIHVSADGRFVYGSNRGHDSIVVYRVSADGRLQLVEHTNSGGRTPRSFALSPNGRYLLAAHQNSDVITVFAVDAERGTLTPTGETAAVSKPVCVRFASW